MFLLNMSEHDLQFINADDNQIFCSCAEHAGREMFFLAFEDFRFRTHFFIISDHDLQFINADPITRFFVAEQNMLAELVEHGMGTYRKKMNLMLTH